MLPNRVGVSITNQSGSVITTTPTDATSTYELTSAGVCNVDGSPVSGEWLVAGSASAYEVRSTVTSGTLTTDPSAGSWVSLGTTRLWELTRASVGVSTATFTVEIRNASTGAVLDSATIDLTAEESF